MQKASISFSKVPEFSSEKKISMQEIGIDCMPLANPEIMETSSLKNLMLTFTRTIKHLL